MIRTNVPERSQVLWINGPEAIGKSTVAFAIFRQLSDAGTKREFPMNTSKPMMDSELAAFLDRLHPVAESTAVWLGGAIRLTLKSYLGSELPPFAYVGARSFSAMMTC
jgi:hypothetical protein